MAGVSRDLPGSKSSPSGRTAFLDDRERTMSPASGPPNLPGSFSRGYYAEATTVALDQVRRGGANLSDVNRTRLLDAKERAMTDFLNYLRPPASRLARVPGDVRHLQVDRCSRPVECVPMAKPVVNSIASGGEYEFSPEGAIRSALWGCRRSVIGLRRAGAQADTVALKVFDLSSPYLLLPNGPFSILDIIFDPNSLAIATVLESINDYAYQLHRSDLRIHQSHPVLA